MQKLINKIISDLGDDKPIKQILLKSQIVAARLGNDEFKKWIHHEQNGYPDVKEIPDYRKLNAIIKADISIPFQGIIHDYPIPIGIINNDIIEDCLYHILVKTSLPEIENLCKGKNDKNICMTCPSIAYAEVNRHIQGNAEKVWQETSAASLLGIIDTFKSKLLSFFLDLDEGITAGIDFTKIEGQNSINKIMTNYNINAVVANTGNGIVNTGEIGNNNMTQYIIDPLEKEKIMPVIEKLSKESESFNNEDLKEAISTLKEETKKPSWGKRVMRLALNAAGNIATNIAADQLMPLITQALALL